MIEAVEDAMDYSAPPSHPAVDTAGGKVGDGDVGMFPASQGSVGEQANAHKVGVVTDGWDQPYEGIIVCVGGGSTSFSGSFSS